MAVLTNFIQAGDYTDNVGVTFSCTNPLADISDMGNATRPIFGLLWDVPGEFNATIWYVTI